MDVPICPPTLHKQFQTFTGNRLVINHLPIHPLPFLPTRHPYPVLPHSATPLTPCICRFSCPRIDDLLSAGTLYRKGVYDRKTGVFLTKAPHYPSSTPAYTPISCKLLDKRLRFPRENTLFDPFNPVLTGHYPAAAPPVTLPDAPYTSPDHLNAPETTR